MCFRICNVWLEGMRDGSEVQSWLCLVEGTLGSSAVHAAVGLRETIFGVLRREKLQDQTFHPDKLQHWSIVSCWG